MQDADSRSLLTDIFNAALSAVQGEKIIPARSRLDQDSWICDLGQPPLHWRLPANGRVLVVGAGKATASLALGLETVLADRIDDGVIVVKHGHAEPLKRIRTYEGGHPIPDAAGAAGAQAMLDLVQDLSPDDRVFVLLTGGASALLAAPAEGLTLDDEAVVTTSLLRSGAAIEEINTVRKRLSRIKGGGLLRAIAPAQCVTLLVSDVPSNDVGMVGSGPTIPDGAAPGAAMAILERYGLVGDLPPAVVQALQRSRSDPSSPAMPTVIMLANSDTALDAAIGRSRELGLEIGSVDRRMSGDTHAAAAAFVEALRAAAGRRRAGGPPAVVLAAGETTLQVKGRGKGGRNQEFALVAARLLEGQSGLSLLSAGTDGTDGPTDAAGAFADGGTAGRAGAAGVNLAAALADNDSYTAFGALDDLLVTGPTGTNVMDLVIGIAR
jgi:glycerate 2-kinase